MWFSRNLPRQQLWCRTATDGSCPALIRAALDVDRTLIAMVFGGAIYLAMFWVIMLVAPYIAALIYYPIVRQLARGSIKPSATTKREPTRGT